MNIALTQAIAVIQAKIAVLESKVHAFTDLADMQAFRTLKRKVNLFIESKSAGRETPIDPLSHVRSELFAVVKAMELTEQYFSNCMAYDLPKEGKIVLTKAGLSQEKQEYERKHCCPNITQTAVIGYGSRVFWFCNPMPEMPVKWGFSQTARRSISVELCRVPSQFGDVF